MQRGGLTAKAVGPFIFDIAGVMIELNHENITIITQAS